nr:phospholipase A [Lysobacter sp. GX 14042]
MLLALFTGPAPAQQPAAPPEPSACTSIDVDAERLRCYDAALGRAAATPEEADALAARARQLAAELDRASVEGRRELPARDRARHALSDLFRSEGGSEIDAHIANAGKGGLLDRRWELARDSKLGTFNFRGYKPVYLLPVFWSANPNERPTPSGGGDEHGNVEGGALDDVEAKFQISFKTKAMENILGDNGDLWLGYTQSSRWQVFNSEASRPFRETNYEPEALLVFRTGYSLGGWRGRMWGLGINHQSNGRGDPYSRSWNRVVGVVGFDRDNWALTIRPWWRISENGEDDNPGIEDYIGRGDMTLVHVHDGHEFSLMARHSLRTGEDSRGALRFTWAFPLGDNIRGHLQVFDGYGESLIDYDHRSTHVGLGVSLLEWF